MTTVDLTRIPEVYRERVQRLVTAARDATLCATNVNDPHTALAPFLAIADEADKVYLLEPDPNNAPGARADVWARRMAEVEATIAQPEPPPGYWSGGVAVERKAAADPVADMRAEAAAAADPVAARMMRTTADGWERAAKGAEEGPLCEWGLCREPLSAPPRQGCQAPHLHVSDEDGVSPDLAADAARAVRAAQRAHLDSTRAVEIATRAIVEEVGCDAEEAGSTAFAVIEALDGAGWDPIGGRPTAPDVLTGTVQTEARLDIGDAVALRVALDGLLRYLAGKPRETVATINALLRTLPHSQYVSVGLGTSTPEAHALLVSLGGHDRVVDYYGSAMHHCCVELDGIEWRASYTPAPGLPSIAGAAGLDMAASAGGDR